VKIVAFRNEYIVREKRYINARGCLNTYHIPTTCVLYVVSGLHVCVCVRLSSHVTRTETRNRN
jgi:hypothetical protein